MTTAATIDGISFAVNPSSIAWNYNVKLSVQETIGGKVIQLYGWSMGDLVISGSFGKSGVDAQMAFVNMVESIAEKQAPGVPTGAGGAKGSKPVRFLWADQGWDFWVFVRAITQVGASVAVETSPQMINPKYNLTLFVYEDNGKIMQAATDSAMTSYMKRLTAGLGWAQSEWNAPVKADSVQELLKGKSFIDYAFTQFGLPNINSSIQ